jgi:hypothetical protein
VRLTSPGQFLAVGLALMVLGTVLLEADAAETWTGLLVLALGAVAIAGAITSRDRGGD